MFFLMAFVENTCLVYMLLVGCFRVMKVRAINRNDGAVSYGAPKRQMILSSRSRGKALEKMVYEIFLIFGFFLTFYLIFLIFFDFFQQTVRDFF